MTGYEFHCGSPVCDTRFSAPTRDELIARMLTHVRVKHKIAEPTKSIAQFLEENTIREVTETGGRS